jgi:hypothetical protein
MVQVPELKVRTGRPPKYSDNCASNACTLGPLVIQPERRHVAHRRDGGFIDRVGLENGRKGS